MKSKKSIKKIKEQETPLTIHDIAKIAGVSSSTVSRVFHSPELVKKETRKKIQSTIDKFNYAPNPYASALTTKKTMTIGLVIPTVRNSIHASLIESIQYTCHQKGYSLIIGNTDYAIDTESNLLEVMLTRRVSGIIHAGTFQKTSLDILRNAAEHKTPSVIVWENIKDNEISSVGLDNYQAGYDATEYLIQKGHKKIGLLIGPYTIMKRIELRLAGYKKCMKHYGLSVKDTMVVSANHRVNEGADAGGKLLEQFPEMTAVFAASDVLALGACHQFKIAGKRIPEDISVVGFDDIEFAAYCDPPLTTIRVPAVKMGENAVNELIDRIASERIESKSIVFDHQIIERNSVQPAWGVLNSTISG